MAQLNPYINFSGNCREAMNFYKDCLGGDLNLQTVAESPIAAQCPAAMQQQILHGTLIKDGLVIMGSDMTTPEGFVKGDNIALSISCTSEEEIKTFFSNLSKDGKVFHELNVSFWGATFGVFADKFGIRWMLNYDKNANIK